MTTMHTIIHGERMADGIVREHSEMLGGCGIRGRSMVLSSTGIAVPLLASLELAAAVLRSECLVGDLRGIKD